MKDPDFEIFEAQRKRAVEIGNADDTSSHGELLALLKSPYPIVRKAAAGALVKIHVKHPSFAASARFILMDAIVRETGEQVRQYLLRALLPAAGELNAVDCENLRDLARNPTLKPYVRAAAAEVLAAAEAAERRREAKMRHWCTRCRRPVTAEESAAGIRAYGKPYCRHCLEERRFEDLNFEADVERAKRLRTVDEVAVQSQGEKRIGDWLARHHIGYRYDERIRLAGDLAIRPDFYLPEFDVYIEYWGMNTPEYVENMRKKQFLYQRDRKKLISLSWRDQDRLEELLAEKLSRYANIGPAAGTDFTSTSSPFRPSAPEPGPVPAQSCGVGVGSHAESLSHGGGGNGSRAESLSHGGGGNGSHAESLSHGGGRVWG